MSIADKLHEILIVNKVYSGRLPSQVQAVGIDADEVIAELVEMLEWCQDAVDPYLVDCRKLDELVNKYKKGE